MSAFEPRWASEMPRLTPGVCGGSLVTLDVPRNGVCSILKDELCGILTTEVCGAILTAGIEICGTTRGIGTDMRGMENEGMRMENASTSVAPLKPRSMTPAHTLPCAKRCTLSPYRNGFVSRLLRVFAPRLALLAVGAHKDKLRITADGGKEQC